MFVSRNGNSHAEDLGNFHTTSISLTLSNLTEVQPISIVYFTSRGVRLALGESNELGISGANGVW